VSQNDIALIKLSSPAPISSYIRPICLPSASELQFQNQDGLNLRVSGWGAIDSSGDQSDVLKYADLKSLSLKSCRKYWSDQLDNTMICASEQTSSSCQGDSGGPIQYEKNGRVYLAGVVSFGTVGCRGAPGVYSCVAKNVNWVKQTMNG